MKKKLKNLMLVISILSIFIISAPVKANDTSIFYTDIVTYINHYPLPSYVINGEVYIVAEDLRNLGFSVVWDEQNRTLGIDYASDKQMQDMYFNSIDSVYDIEYAIAQWSDIAVYIGYNKLTSYSVNGYTLIPFEQLDIFGNIYWYENTRSLELCVDRLPYRDDYLIPDKIYVNSDWDIYRIIDCPACLGVGNLPYICSMCDGTGVKFGTTCICGGSGLSRCMQCFGSGTEIQWLN